MWVSTEGGCSQGSKVAWSIGKIGRQHRWKGTATSSRLSWWVIHGCAQFAVVVVL